MLRGKLYQKKRTIYGPVGGYHTYDPARVGDSLLSEFDLSQQPSETCKYGDHHELAELNAYVKE